MLGRLHLCIGSLWHRPRKLVDDVGDVEQSQLSQVHQVNLRLPDIFKKLPFWLIEWEFLSYTLSVFTGLQLPPYVLFKHGPGLACPGDCEHPVPTVSGDLHPTYQRDVSHVRFSNAAHHRHLLQNLEHRLVTSSGHQVVEVDGGDGLRLLTRIRCVTVEGVVVRVVDSDAVIRLGVVSSQSSACRYR